MHYFKLSSKPTFVFIQRSLWSKSLPLFYVFHSVKILLLFPFIFILILCVYFWLFGRPCCSLHASERRSRLWLWYYQVRLKNKKKVKFSSIGIPRHLLKIFKDIERIVGFVDRDSHMFFLSLVNFGTLIIPHLSHNIQHHYKWRHKGMLLQH